MSAPHFPPLGLTLADLYPDRRRNPPARKEQEQTQHNNQSWLGDLTAILDTSALVIAGSEGAYRRQAKLTQLADQCMGRKFHSTRNRTGNMG